MNRPIGMVVACVFSLAVQVPCEVKAETLPADGFNKYILESVKDIEANYPSKGYNINKAYTHNLSYGAGTVKATDAPWTMCVAATAEVIIGAINRYVEETGDKTPYTYLPVVGWNRMRPTDIRAHIWVDPRLDSYGTADALVTFGVGKRVKFGELTPGSFVNINRLNKSGHSVVFMSFIDKDGNDLSSYSDDARGFRYFSAQGKGAQGGFGYRYAFFAKDIKHPFCPTLPPGKQRDCKVIWSTGQKLLNTGYMLMPSKWDAKSRDQNFRDIIDGLYVQTRSRGGGFLGISPDLSIDQFKQELDAQDTMELNPIFEGANETTD